MTGLCTFYSPPARAALASKPLVYCVDADTPRNQFFFWPEYQYRDNRHGQNAIFAIDYLIPLESGWFGKWLKGEPLGHAAGTALPLPARIQDEFESVTDLGDFEIKIGNRLYRRVHLWACYHLK